MSFRIVMGLECSLLGTIVNVRISVVMKWLRQWLRIWVDVSVAARPSVARGLQIQADQKRIGRFLHFIPQVVHCAIHLL